jgi:hypothetical protein
MVLAEPTYPENFTPQIVDQDKEYIAEQSQALASSGTTETGSDDAFTLDLKYQQNVEPIIFYQDKTTFPIIDSNDRK